MKNIVERLRGNGQRPYFGDGATMYDAAAEIERLRARIAELEGAVVWALGYTDFRERREGEGAYWWRKELRERAGMNDERARTMIAAANPSRPSPHEGSPSD